MTQQPLVDQKYIDIAASNMAVTTKEHASLMEEVLNNMVALLDKKK